ncbi:non-ribosomal peptide synthetase [Pseudomonas fluorescens group sp.]|uniref:Non-ribosomal peptide synthetase n=2 Tax=Pseudomonas fluorescens TaxID=294 RepID=C3KC53_PSEFS|nr:MULTISPECIES: non-ribosomal peptide synthetase [Pseudomonas fluorescens group]MBZ6454250.1 non-ribosomal peptide synthetase [Pseudomonas fluorescens group sp.]MBZ6460236.1 non-ribosomal peptide synthetase [Pseudomonas fluorescens group sp.]MBZ6465877.1 non-ribosomal peptide synthetase [Pseudomonas fluorescens group sp.]WQD69596.1 non-ribosomal peptide synthetase [Pseudomonas marginalis]CAI2797439.1 Putative non-ribosomal peptide synthetase [Pseudomonas fluorescens SBW25]
MTTEKTTSNPIEDVYPLSPLQQGMLFHSLLHEDSGVYLMQDRYRIGGAIDEGAFLESWRQVVALHPSLRASFQWKTQKQPVQVIHREVKVPLDTLDLRGLAPHEQEARIRSLLENEQKIGFNLSKPPLIRFRLVRLADESYEFIRSFHHILMDAWCISLVTVDFLKVYEALCNDRTPQIKSPRPFRDYIQWLQRQDAGKAEQFWRGQLQGLNAPTPLTVDNGVSRDRYTDAVRVADQLIHLSEDDTQALAAFCRHRRITPNTFFQGVWSLLLSRYSGQRDVVFGVTVAGRPAELTGVAEMIGLFINTLPLRVSVDPQATLGDWLTALQGLNVEMRDFEHTPLTDIQGWSDFPRGETLFDSILVFENAPIDEQILDGGFEFSLDGMDHSVHTHYGLTVVILPGEQLGIRVSYDRERFEADTVQRLLGHLASLVRGMLAAPEAPLGSFELLAADERQQLLGEWALNPHDFPLHKSYAELFAAQVAERGDQIAAICAGESLTYAELDLRATRLAQALRTAGAGADQLVALVAPRGLALLTSMIAVFKAGAAMLPLEVNHPPERLREILNLSRAPLLVASEECRGLLDPLLSGLEHAPTALFAEAAWNTPNDAPFTLAGGPDSLAYVLFTSGSTGTPKGVMIEQRGMLNNIFGKVPALGLSANDRIPQTASVAFDISVWQFLAAPVLGATVHILPDEVAHDPQRLLQVLASERLNVLEIVPSLMRTLLALCPCDLQLPDLRWVLPTGEALPPTVARDWFARFPDIALMNAYGPAECADDVAFQPITQAPHANVSHMPIGQPTANNRLYVLDEALRPVPIGVAGEICVGGVGVGRGYLHDPQRTTEAFIQHPQIDGRLYRTGDLGRWCADGVIEYLGRRDQQVKLRGHRIELTEIEHRLAQHPNVREAAVLLRENSAGEAWLVAYWSAHDDTLGSTGLSEHLRAQLPPYMVPAAFECLERLPLNNNGKVDRKALAALQLNWQADTRESLAPRNEHEATIAKVWADVLGRDSVGVEDNFFTLGGHSLLATQIVARLRSQFKLDLPLRVLFEQPTVALLAVAIAEREAQAAAPQAVALDTPHAKARPALLPLSFSQQRLWFIEQLTPGTTLFNIPFALHLKGELNVPALNASLNDLLARHEILRTGIRSVDGVPSQHISDALEVALPFEDLSGLGATAREGAQFTALQATFEQPFDLTEPPLLRARLLKVAPGEHVLGIALHHLVSDAWSATIALRELALGYEARCNGSAAQLAALPLQYADFALWQRDHLQGAELKRQLDYWTRTLDRSDQDASPLLALPTDHPRPSVQSYLAGLVQRELSADLSGRVQALASRLGTTPFSVVFAGFAVLMHRLSGDATVLIGTPVTHREQPGTEGLLGILLNNLAIRADFTAQADFSAVVSQVATRLREGLQHQDLPFEQLVDSLQLPRSLSHAPLYQVMVAQQLAMESRLQFPGLAFEALDTPLKHSECDLDLHVLCPANAPIQLELMFALDLFTQDSARQTLARLEHLLQQMLAEPQRPVAALPLLMPAEWQRTVVEWNRTEMDVPQHLTFAQLFEQQAERTPQRDALCFEGQRLSYAELNRRANQVAHYLRAQGVVANCPVALCVERSLELLIGLLGILKAGGAYVPLDPGYPAERLAYMLEDAQPALFLGQQGLLEQLGGDLPRLRLDADAALLAAQPESNPAALAGPDDLAYIMYTSGSTGKPKGTLVTHTSVVNLAWARIHGLYRRYTDQPMRTSFNYSFAFDSSVAELILLLDGHSLYLTPEDVRYDPAALAQFFQETRLDAFECTPAQLKSLLETDGVRRGETYLPRFVLFGGDAVDAQLWQRLPSISGSRFFNTYGPTECTVDATGCAVDDFPQRPIIGRPIANVRTYVLDAFLNPMPVGVPGELHIGGAGVTLGYLNRAEQTAKVFINDPFSPLPQARMYKSGDLVRWLPDGQLEYLGRMDHQVKIRGFRVELGEIEALIGAQPGVRQAVVLAREDVQGDKRLVAYVTCDQPADMNAWRNRLGAALPDYMVPSAFVVLDELPLTDNGKLNRKALPAPDIQAEPNAEDPPRTDAERQLAALWAELLNVPLGAIGRDSQFFYLGGHSLLAAVLFARLRQQFSTVPPLRAVFEHPTLQALAALLAQPLQAPAATFVPMTRPARLPLSFEQQRLWFLEQLSGASEYNVVSAVQFDGELNVQALQSALNTVIQRHEILRSRILREADGELALVIEPQGELTLAVAQWDAVSDERWQQLTDAAIQAATAQRFDLAHEVPMRAALLQRNRQALLVLTLHHCATDDASTQNLLDELAQCYSADCQGHAAHLPALALQYPDYALWQRESAQQALFDSQLAYWRTQLEDGSYQLELPTDQPRPHVLDPRAGSVQLQLPAELSGRLRQFAQQRGATLYMLLLSAAQLLLGRYANQRDVRFGSPVAQRPLAELQPLIGCFVNTLVMRADLAPGLDFIGLLDQVRNTVLDAQQHQDVPFDQVVEHLAPERSLGQTPLFQVLFVMQNANTGASQWPQLQVSERAVTADATKFDLNWEVHDGEVLSVLLEYRSALFTQATAERWLAQWQALLESMLEAPQTRLTDWSPLAVAERQQQLAWNTTERHYPGPQDLRTALSQQAALTPNAPALVFEGQRLSYAELDQRAQRVARALRAAGIGRESIVPVCMERSVDMVVALLGVVHAGAAWLPLDPELPAARLAFLIADAEAQVTLTQPQWLPHLPVGHTAWTLETLPAAANGKPLSVEASDLAYVLYTSGSTGQPKGVMNEHGALMNRLHWMQDAFPIGPDDRVLQKTPYSFDVSVWEFFWPLITGATLVVARPDGHRDPAYLSQLIQQEQVTTLHFVPSMLRVFVEEPSLVNCRSLRQVFASGEALPVDLVQRFMSQHPAALVNLYGPTEAAIDVSVWRCSVNDTLVPIGKPIANLRLHILDDAQQPLPIGSIGELYIGGVGVARGYLKRADLTAERFLMVNGERLYRTGDRCRFLADGNIDYLGRLDHQVKLRGQRIELGEIDAALLAQPNVRDAATLLLDQRLVSFWSGDADEATLRAGLGDHLPTHMLPGLLVRLDQLPLNSNGKLDRKALAAINLPDASREKPHRAPHTPTQKLLCELFSDVLACPLVGLDDHFFHLGGHSLLATRLVAQVRERLGVTLPLALVFAHPTVAALAEHLRDALPSEEFTAQPRPAALPLGLAQHRFWMLSRLVPDSREYHMPFALTLKGALDLPALRRAFDQVSERHLVLRSRIVEIAGEAQLLIDPQGPALRVTSVATDDWETACSRAEADLMAPFDLATAAPWRAQLLQRQDSDENRLLLCLHHSATDGWAMQLLIDELAQAYRAGRDGQAPDWAPLDLDYVDFALWQQHPQTQARRQASLDYWKNHLGADDYSLDLPLDQPRAAEADRRAGQLHISLGTERSAAIRQFARLRGTTPYVVLASALSALLARYSGQRDIRLGTPSDQREQPQTQALLACLVNTLVIRCEVDQQAPASALLAALEADLRTAQAHADLPFATLVGAITQRRDLNRTPLFQVLFSLNHGRMDSRQWPGLDLTEQPLPAIDAKFEQSWEVHDDGSDITLALEYQTALFSAATMQRWSAQWCALLDALIAAPERALVELFPQQQDHAQLARWNATERHYSGPTNLHTALSQQAALTPNAPALVFEGQRLSYAELDQRAQRVARALRAAGIGRESIVPVCMERSVDMVVVLLGVVHAGAAWLPLDPELPAARLAFLIADAEAQVTLTQPQWLSHLPVGHTAWTLETLPAAANGEPLSVEASDLAYVLYTSGSTGQPKGVMNEHGALMNRLHWMQDAFPIGPDDRVLQKTPYSFDVSVWEFFWPLITGATLVVARPDGHRDPAYLSQLIQQEQVTTLHFVPSMLRVFVEEPSLVNCRSLRQVFASGEALPVDLVQRFMSQHPAALVNLYGPTEAAIDVSVWRCSVNDTLVPIGKPIANLRLHILDDAQQPLPIGSIGELYIGGVGVARGYLKRADLTAERFLMVNGERLYRTGDRCRFLADGNIDYLGRLDHQVKLRGQRIELGEVDAALLSQPGITGACTLVIDNRLVAFYSSNAPQSELGAALSAELPAYMVPAVWVEVPSLPLTTNGKLDRKALAALPLPPSQHAPVAPRNALESLVCQLFSDVLGDGLTGGRVVGTADSFFALGGDSILGLKLISQLRDQGYALTPKDLFRAQTPAGLALVITPLLAVAEQGDVSGAMPLMPLHQWFFDQQQPQPAYWNQSVLADSDRVLQPALVQATLDRLIAHHDALRLRFIEVDGQWQAHIAAVEPARLTLATDVGQLQHVAQSLDLQHGPLFAAALLDGAPQRLYLVAHHLVIDAVSWAPLLEDFQQLYAALENGTPASLPAKTTSYRQWAEHMHAHAGKVAAEQRYWASQVATNPRPQATIAERQTLSARWDATRTHQWLTESHAAYRTQPEELLIAALVATLAQAEQRQDIVVDLERHGRDAGFEGLDVSRTVGWFTTLFPLRVNARGAVGDWVRQAKEALRGVPGQGLGHGLLRLRGDLPAGSGDVLFNYLGHEQTSPGWLRASSLAAPSEVALVNRVSHAREVVAWLEDGVLNLHWHSANPVADRDLPAQLLKHLQALLEHCLDPQAGALMPSDFPLAKALNQKSLETLLGKLKNKPNS